MGLAVQTAPALFEPALQPALPRWNLPKRIAFRLAFSYLMLYNLPMMGHVNLLDAIPGVSWLSEKYIRVWHTVVPWVAIHLFKLSGPVTVYPAVNGSGDTTLDYVEDFCIVAVALLATLVWSLLDFKRTGYRRLHFYLRIYTRYALSLTLFGYGFAKVIPTQFIFPTFGRLVEPLGEFSPMGLLWNFMGYSTAYMVFSGLAEVTGATLLLFRRTATLGAMSSAAVLLNVVMLNFCYDVPVKLYSLNLLLMAIFLMIPDLGRLANLLVLNRPTEAVKISLPEFEIRWVKIGAVVFQVLFVGYQWALRSGGLYASRCRCHPLASSGDSITHFLQLNRLLLSMVTLFFASLFSVLITCDESSIIRTAKFLLVNRGFHWINERPFNR